MSLQLATVLLQHQQDGVVAALRRLEQFGVVLVWWHPGSGKTLLTFAVTLALQLEHWPVRVPMPPAWRAALQNRRESDNYYAKVLQPRMDTCGDEENAPYLQRVLSFSRRQKRAEEDAAQQQRDQEEQLRNSNVSSSSATTASTSLGGVPLLVADEERKNFLLNSRATLVVCLKSARATWAEEAKKHIVGGALIQTVDADQTYDWRNFAHADYVLTTYETVLSAYRRVQGALVDLERKDTTDPSHQSPFRNTVAFDQKTQHALTPVLSLDRPQDCDDASLLFLFQWQNLVFDESHTVRTQIGKRYRACVRLCARNRIALSGSPMRNQPSTEVFCAFRLLRIAGLPPMSEWMQSLLPERSVLRRKTKREQKAEEKKRVFAALEMAINSPLVGMGTVSAAAQTTPTAETSEGEGKGAEGAGEREYNAVPIAKFVASSTRSLRKRKTAPKKEQRPQKEDDDNAEEEEGEDRNDSEDEDFDLKDEQYEEGGEVSTTSFAAMFTKDTLAKMAIVCRPDDIDIGIPDCEELVVCQRFRNAAEMEFYKCCRDRLNKTTIQTHSRDATFLGDDEDDDDSGGGGAGGGGAEQNAAGKTIVLHPSMMILRQAANAAATIGARTLLSSSPAAAQQQRFVDSTSPAIVPASTLAEADTPASATVATVATTRAPVEIVLSRATTPWAFEGSTKMQMFREYIERICVRGGEKALCFSHFKRVLDLCENILNSMRIGYVRVDGSVNGEQRHKLIKRFGRNKEIKVFLIIVKAMGESVDGLQVACCNALFIDPWFSPEVTEQAKRRLQRMGQRRTVKIIHLVIEGTYEERVVSIAESRFNLLDAVCEGRLGATNGDGGVGGGNSRLLYDNDGFLLQPHLDQKAIQEQQEEMRQQGRQQQQQQQSSIVIGSGGGGSGERSNNVTVVGGSSGGSSSGSGRKRLKFSSSMVQSSEFSASTAAAATSSATETTSSFSSTSSSSSFAVPHSMDATERQRERYYAELDEEIRLELQQKTDDRLLQWCSENLSHVVEVPAMLISAAPVLFARPSMVFDRRCQFAPIYAPLDAVNVPLKSDFCVQRQLEWRNPQQTFLRLHIVSWQALYDLTQRNQIGGRSAFENLEMALFRQRDAVTRAWARAESTFAPFQYFCTQFPEYMGACQRGLFDGWLCNQLESPVDVPFIVLFDPAKFLIEMK